MGDREKNLRLFPKSSGQAEDTERVGSWCSFLGQARVCQDHWRTSHRIHVCVSSLSAFAFPMAWGKLCYHFIPLMLICRIIRLDQIILRVLKVLWYSDSACFLLQIYSVSPGEQLSLHPQRHVLSIVIIGGSLCARHPGCKARKTADLPLLLPSPFGALPKQLRDTAHVFQGSSGQAFWAVTYSKKLVLLFYKLIHLYFI